MTTKHPTRPAKTPVGNPFAVRENNLLVAGKTLDQWADHIGQTPFFLYERASIDRRIKDLRSQLPEQIHIHYAVKANPLPEVIQYIGQQLDGLDVASAGELQLALDSGMTAQNISFAGPGKTDRELSAAITAGIVVNVESSGELERLARLGHATGIQPRAALRINPDFELKTSGMRMGGGARVFGVDAEQAPELLAHWRTLDIEFLGFHIFSGSQNLSAQRLIEAQNQTFELAYGLAEHAPATVRTLNIGGGFGIPYFPGDLPLELATVANNLARLTVDCKQHLPDASIILELGRYLIGEAGIYVTRVIDRKSSRGETFVVTDGGMHHHLAASGNLGQVIRRNFPLLVGNRMTAKAQEKVNVCGPLCTPLDVLGQGVELPAAKPGDFIVVLQSGAYAKTASPNDFLGHPQAVERLV